MDIGDRMGGVPGKSARVPKMGCLLLGIGGGGALLFLIVDNPGLMRIFLAVLAAGALWTALSWAIRTRGCR